MGTRNLVTLPQDEGAERAIIGCLLVAPDKLARVPLTEDHFHGHATRQVFRAIRGLAQRGEPVDLVTVYAEMRRAGCEVSAALLAEFTAEDCIVPEPHFRLLEEQRRRRELVRGADALSRLARDATTRLDDALPAALALLKRGLASRVAYTHTALLPEVLASRAEALTRAPFEDIERVKSGFTAIDGLGGLPRGELTVLAGRPGMGKSALVQQIAVHVARAGHSVLIASPEMGRAGIADRLLAQSADVDLLRLQRGRLNPAEVDRVRAVAGMAPPVVIYDQGDMSTADIAGVAGQLALSAPLDVVVVDHLQYLADPPIKAEGEAVRIGRMTRALKALARRLGAAMLVCSQLNRECEGRKDKRPELADLRASGTIEQDADLVFLLFRPGYYDEDAAAGGQTELLVAKHRNGPTGVRRLVWDGTRTAFYDPHPVPAPDRAEGWS